MNTCEIGREGEEQALEWLRQNGYRVIFTNFRRRGFEIDIIAIKGSILKFIEVKTISKGSIMDAAYSAQTRNMQNYYNGVDAFLAKFPEYLDYAITMDVLIITPRKIYLYENVTRDNLL